MEDCVMIADGAMGAGARTCVRVCVSDGVLKRVKTSTSGGLDG